MSTVISTPISSIKRSGPIGIPHSNSASSIFSALDAVLEKFRGIEQIRKQNAVHEEPGTVAHHHRQLADLAGKSRARGRCVSSEVCLADHDFDQFHSADRIEKMQTDDAARAFRFRPRDRRLASAEVFVARISLCRRSLQSRSRKISLLISIFSEAASITIWTSRISIRRAGGNDAGAAFLRFLLRHESAFDRVGVSFLDVGQAAIEFFAFRRRAKSPKRRAS